MSEVRNPELIAALDDLIQKTDQEDSKLFLRFVREVWQVDQSYSPLAILQRLQSGNFGFFIDCMSQDDGEVDDDEDDLLSAAWCQSWDYFDESEQRKEMFRVLANLKTQVLNPELMPELDKLIQNTQEEDAKLFLRAVREVWQVDQSYSPFAIFDHLQSRDIRFFLNCMHNDDDQIDQDEHDFLSQALVRYWDSWEKYAQIIAALTKLKGGKLGKMEQLDTLIQSTGDEGQNLFLRGVREVWQVDDSYPPLEILNHLEHADLGFFRNFLIRDDGTIDNDESNFFDQLRYSYRIFCRWDFREKRDQYHVLCQELNTL